MLTDDELDALDTFALAHLAPNGEESVREFARAVERAAYEAAIKVCDERKGRTTWVQSWADHNAGCEGCAESIHSLMPEQPK